MVLDCLEQVPPFEQCFFTDHTILSPNQSFWRRGNCTDHKFDCVQFYSLKLGGCIRPGRWEKSQHRKGLSRLINIKIANVINDVSKNERQSHLRESREV